MMPSTLNAFIWYFLKHHKIALMALMTTAVIWAIEMSLSPYLLKLIIDGVNTHENTPNSLIPAILIPCILYVSMSLVLNLNFRFYDYVSLKIFPAVKNNVINGMFNYLSQHSHAYFQNHFSGTLAKRIVDMAESIEPVIRTPIDVFAPRIFALITACLFLYPVSYVFSLILIVWSVIFVLISFILAKGSEEKSFSLARSVASLNGAIVDSVSNILSTKIFSNIAYEKKRINESVGSVVKNDRGLQWYILKVQFIQALLTTVLTAALIICLIWGRKAGWVSVGDFAFVLTLAISFILGIWTLGQEMVLFSKEMGTCRQALRIIAEPHEIIDVPNAKILTVTSGDIAFNNVTFVYENNEPIFQHLNIRIPAGQKVGLVGYSGGGKSTFVKLILRLYDIAAGEIQIDGQNIKEVTKDSLRQQIGMIPQEAELFHRTVMENIRYGRLNASDEEVIQAAKMAHCHEFVMELSEGYQTMVGERGIKLSGGQRQRVAIARAVLKNAPILMLDEATSALDSITEQYIQDSLDKMMEHKTTLVIAHRLSTLKMMDRILFFKEGKIIEDGSFAELTTLPGGHFKRLWDMQAGGFIPDDED